MSTAEATPARDLGEVAEQPSREGGRRRRPTGEAPPLPRHQRLKALRWTVVAAVAVIVSLVVFWYAESGWIVATDEAISRGVAGQRSDVVVQVARGLDWLSDEWVLRVPRWGVIVTLIAVRRIRVLLVFIGSILVSEWLALGLDALIQRPRPMVEIIGDWEGFSHPSLPIVALTVTLVGLVRALVPDGRWRRLATAGVGGLIALVGLSRVLLGLDHSSDVVVGAMLAAGVVFTATRLLVPNDRYPVVYRRGQTAHVDLDDGRCEAITVAVRDQLGLHVREIELFSPDGSAGSTPVKLTLDGAEDEAVFGKLLTGQHLRSDRLYKFARFLMYGRLEDEQPFSSVRRLVEYEDHMTRVLDDAGVAVPRSFGIVEITPEREYLIVFEMVPGVDFDPEVPVSDTLLDNSLRLVRQLWDSGMAHRDVKPGNLLVDGDRIHLIDVAFAQVRPSPWRQAVDLGAMLLLLALATEPQKVIRHARAVFTDDELAEALAAANGFAIPGQLRGLLGDHEGDLLEELRALVPEREPIHVHRWGAKRILLLGVVVVTALTTIFVLWSLFATVGLL